MLDDFGIPLTIAGPGGAGYSRWYADTVAAEAKGHKVKIMGEVSETVKRHLLQDAPALLYAINYPEGTSEAHSMKMVNAMLCGTPCVTERVGAMPEVIDDGLTGRYADGDWGAALARAAVMDRRVVREQAVARWSVQSAVERLLPWYDAVAEGHRW